MSSSERQGQGLICASFPELLVSTLMNLTCGGVGTAHESAGWTERKWFYGGAGIHANLGELRGFPWEEKARTSKLSSSLVGAGF